MKLPGGCYCYGLIRLLPLLPGAVQAAFPQLKLEVICDSQLDSPVAMVSPAGGPVVLTFRRGPLATDLTCRAQGSTNLTNWTDLATRTAGAIPSGTGLVSETVVDTSFRNVTVHDNVPQGAARRLYRLKVTRL